MPVVKVGAGEGGGVVALSPGVTMDHVARKVGLGYRSFRAGVEQRIVPVVGTDLVTVEYASKLRSECLWTGSAKVNNPADLTILLQVGPVLAGGCNVYVCCGGTVSWAPLLFRMNSASVIMETYSFRVPVQATFETHLDLMQDEGDIWVIENDGAVTGDVMVNLIVRRCW